MMRREITVDLLIQQDMFAPAGRARAVIDFPAAPLLASQATLSLRRTR